MWQTHHGQLPASLHSALGLGAEPVFSHSDQAWYQKSGTSVVRWSPTKMQMIRRSAAQIPGGLGDDPQSPDAPSATGDANLLAAANALNGTGNPCDVAASGSVVKAFQTAWNAAGASGSDSRATGNTLTVDGFYGPSTESAVAVAIGGSTNKPGGCTSYTNAGGASPSPQPTITPPSGTATSTAKSWLVPALIAGAAGSLGLIGWAAYKKNHHKRR